MSRLLIFGAGGISAAVRDNNPTDWVVNEVYRGEADVRNLTEVRAAIRAIRPDFILNCAGVSDKVADRRETVDVNLEGAMNVAVEGAKAFGIPVILIASVAGVSPSVHHPIYSAAKAGVIAFVRSWAEIGNAIWAVSPGRVDTPMREADWPDEDLQTRLRPSQVAEVVWDVVDGRYEPGANVIIRKVGLNRVDVYEEPRLQMPSLL